VTLEEYGCDSGPLDGAREIRRFEDEVFEDRAFKDRDEFDVEDEVEVFKDGVFKDRAFEEVVFEDREDWFSVDWVSATSMDMYKSMSLSRMLPDSTRSRYSDPQQMSS